MNVFNGHTDSAGAFVAPQVIPRTYRVTVTAPGLKQAVVNDLVATVAQVASVNITMQLDQNSEVVTVKSRGEQGPILGTALRARTVSPGRPVQRQTKFS